MNSKLKYISESVGENLQANDHVVISLRRTKPQKLSAPHPSENKDWFTYRGLLASFLFYSAFQTFRQSGFYMIYLIIIYVSFQNIMNTSKQKHKKFR